MSKSNTGPDRGVDPLRAENDRLRTLLDARTAVLEYREEELLRLKGPCSSPECRLHYAHSGPCDIRSVGASA